MLKTNPTVPISHHAPLSVNTLTEHCVTVYISICGHFKLYISFTESRPPHHPIIWFYWQKYLYIYFLGPVATEVGSFDCASACAKRGFICAENFDTKNSKQIFTDAKINCSNEEIHPDWSKPYHPLYFVHNHLCVGYKNLPRSVGDYCTNVTVPQYLKGTRRICNCVDPGTFVFHKQLHLSSQLGVAY